MHAKNSHNETRTLHQLKEHYLVETELADKLRNATKSERKSLYSSLYEELYRRVPLHPQLTRKTSTEESTESVENQMRLLRPHLKPHMTFLEIGAGDCAVSFAAAKLVNKVIAVDVSKTITNHDLTPANFELAISDGTTIPTPQNSVDVIYSNQLMEHLHPDDAYEQLQNVYNALKEGSAYICVTPNRLDGPHDISVYFDKHATGFHLKEYTFSDLHKLLQKVGFRRTEVHVSIKGKHIKAPATLIFLMEAILLKLPTPISEPLIGRTFIGKLLNGCVIGIK